jgi:hypothetical protein
MASLHPPSGAPTAQEIKNAFDRASVQRAFVDDGDVACARGAVSMHDVALGGISLVTRLMDELGESVTKAGASTVLEFPRNVPIFTYTHECRLLTECHPFALASGVVAKMMPCARGNACMGMCEHFDGHEASGGIVLRALLTPAELTSFEQTGANPAGPRLCILCARLYVCEAYFETQDARYETLTRGACFNFYGNLRGCHDGYKAEHTIPLGSGSRWSGLLAPVACNSLSKMRIRKRAGVWGVDQSELAFTEPRDAHMGSSDAGQYFRQRTA